MAIIQTLGLALGLAFASGGRLYLAALTLGLGFRFGYFALSPKLSELHWLSDTTVLIAIGAATVTEIVVTKLPWAGNLWDSLHTVINPIGSAVLLSLTLGRSSLVTKLILVLMGTAVSVGAHTLTAASRFWVNLNRGWFSNIGLSFLEDIFVPIGVWLSLRHPFAMLNVVIIALIAFAAARAAIFRLMRMEIIAAFHFVNSLLLGKRVRTQDVRLPAKASSKLGSTATILEPIIVPLPAEYRKLLEARTILDDNPPSIECAALNIDDLENSVGYLFFAGDSVFFVTKRRFRLRLHEMQLDCIDETRLSRGMLMDRLSFHTAKGCQTFCLFKSLSIASQPGSTLVHRERAWVRPT